MSFKSTYQINQPYFTGLPASGMGVVALVLFMLFFSSCKKNDRAIVVSKIQSAAKLATTETTIDKVVIGTKKRKWVGLVTLGQANFVAYTKAYVKTGVDLSKLKAEDIKIEDNRIEVTLPRVQVLDFAYPFNEYRIDTILSTNSFLTKMTIYDHEELYRQAELDIRENLEYTGVEAETELHTRQLMTGLLKNLGYEEVYIRFSTEGEFIPMVILPGTKDDPNTQKQKKGLFNWGSKSEEDASNNEGA